MKITTVLISMKKSIWYAVTVYSMYPTQWGKYFELRSERWWGQIMYKALQTGGKKNRVSEDLKRRVVRF